MKFFTFQILIKLSLLTVLVLTQSCALTTAAGITTQGQPIKKVKPDLESLKTAGAKQIDHSQWTGLLQKYVDEAGFVDYKNFKNDRKALTDYLTFLSSKEPSEEWPVQELLAYYINLYNAYTVDLILKHYPVKSIKDIKGAWTKAIVPIGNRTLALGGIENGILRKMKDPRIHFAINCASISCPKLQGEAYTSDKIEEQLDRAASEFINSDKNELDPQNLKLSRIFKWYKKDYLVYDIKTLNEYINQYADAKVNPNAVYNFLPYDWGLNEQK